MSGSWFVGGLHWDPLHHQSQFQQSNQYDYQNYIQDAINKVKAAPQLTRSYPYADKGIIDGEFTVIEVDGKKLLENN